jgi:hypothetical protein
VIEHGSQEGEEGEEGDQEGHQEVDPSRIVGFQQM